MGRLLSSSSQLDVPQEFGRKKVASVMAENETESVNLLPFFLLRIQGNHFHLQAVHALPVLALSFRTDRAHSKKSDQIVDEARAITIKTLLGGSLIFLFEK